MFNKTAESWEQNFSHVINWPKESLREEAIESVDSWSENKRQSLTLDNRSAVTYNVDKTWKTNCVLKRCLPKPLLTHLCVNHNGLEPFASLRQLGVITGNFLGMNRLQSPQHVVYDPMIPKSVRIIFAVRLLWVVQLRLVLTFSQHVASLLAAAGSIVGDVQRT